MATRFDLLSRFVLDAICDDYENLAEVSKHVGGLGQRCGLTFESDEIIRALGDLMNRGLARGFLLTPNSKPPNEVDRLPDEKEIGKYYFRVTQRGMDLQLAPYDEWPFDDENVLRRDWCAPAE